jgi:hypothetical protein
MSDRISAISRANACRPDESDALVPIGRPIAAEHGRRIEPHGEIMEILTFANASYSETRCTRPKASVHR